MNRPTFFDRTGEGEFVPTPLATSPWSNRTISGPAVCGLLARELESNHGWEGFRPARLTIDMFKPAPAAPLRVSTTEVRAGNRIRVADAVLSSGGIEFARASAVFLKVSQQPAGEIWQRAAQPPTPPEELADQLEQHGVPLFGSDTHPTGWSMDMAQHQGVSRKRMWSRVISLVDGEEPSPFVHAAIVGEAASLVTNWGSAGVGFINADLTLTLARLPRGTDLGIETDNHLSADGVATGSAVLYDREGPVGMCVITAISNAARQIDLAQPLETAAR
ncbi:acyl-CoA thioesterase domain-containing protein [Nocardia yamanashiensis]|uniref:acyl-CoA thioesterase domain-containing protein n=1 Tax=Nocardia yamanashiensis TaxID=209247 RepID=UPI00082C3315|nr:acyl-CoA thioesterase domain-containing protein [Nocardia yamanashiensis]